MSRGLKPQPGAKPALRPVWQTMLLLTTGLLIGVTVCKFNEASAFCKAVGWIVSG